MYETLKRVPLFADLPDADLERLCDRVRESAVPRGTILFTEGEAGDVAWVIKDGELEIFKRSGTREVLLAVRRAGEVVGEMALVEDAPRSASGRARTDVCLLAIEKADLAMLIATSPSAARTLFYTVLARWRGTTTALRQSERMVQLGTLSAGVAHELNNPASAVHRSAEQLRSVLATYAESSARTGDLAGLQPWLEAARRPAPWLDPVARSDREAARESWLEEHGADEPWALAAPLARVDLAVDALDELAGAFPDRLDDVLKLLCVTREVEDLVATIGEGSGRISQIVKTLKEWSYLDRAPVQAVDLHQGIENTLMILRAKLVDIAVVREFAADLPHIQAYGAELNQVWANLIDNAADALEGKGTITLRTRRDGDFVEVDVEDDGPGIPPEIQPRIFDAFFTTKPPGKGTGLGLDITWRIVVDRHRGDLSVDSRPGATRFRVRLPIDPK